MATTLNQFIGILAQAGLVPEDELRSIQTKLDEHRDPDALAKELASTGFLTEYQASEFRGGEAHGLVIGEYVLLDPVGKGGMGRVYRARHMLMKRDVAVKLMLPTDDGSSAGSIERFQREVQAASKLSHPNIVSALDAGVEEGNCFFVMEYVRGSNLRDVVYTRGPLSIEQAVDCMIQAAEGLECAHQQGVIHRDIKPSNLLLSSNGVVKVLDMGLVRMHPPGGPEDIAPGDDERLTQRGQILGTVDFMAPEQAIDPHHVDARADIYSLGCTLYFLLTGKPPYGQIDDSPMSRIIAHRESPIPALRAIRPEVSELLERIFRTMLAKHPDRRYPSMSDLLIYLRALQTQMRSPGEAVTETFSRPEEGLRRRPLGLVATAASVVVLLLIGLTYWWVRHRDAKFTVQPLTGTITTPASVATNYWEDHDEPVDLLTKIDLKTDVVLGSDWRLEEGKLFTSSHTPAKLLIRFPVPPQYVLEAQVTRKSGEGPFVIGLVVGDHQCFVLVDRDHNYTGMGAGRDTRMVVKASHIVHLEKDVSVPISCTVRNGMLEVAMNGTTVIGWEGDFADLRLGADWDRGISIRDVLFLGSNNDTVFEVSRLELRPWSEPTAELPTTTPETPDTSAP